MLASRTVCARCRSTLVAGAATIGTVRQNSTTSFTSAGEHTSKPTAQPSQTRAKEVHPRTAIREQNQKRKEAARQRSLDLFESTINSEAQSVPPTQDTGRLYRLANELDAISQNKEKLSDADLAARLYAFIATKLMPVVREKGGRLPQFLRANASQALQKIAGTKLAAIHATELPSVSDICKLYADLGQFKASRRLHFINNLLAAIIAANPASTPSGSAVPVADQMLLNDLVELWKHFSGLKRAESGLGAETTFWLTSRPDMRGTDDPAKLFRALFPHFSGNELDGLAPLLVTTYVLLQDPICERARAKLEAQPLLEAMETIVKRFDRERLQHLFEGYDDLWAFVEPRADWRVIQAAPEALKESPGEGDKSGPKKAAGRFSYPLWHKRFNVAYRGNDHAAVQQAWRDLIDPANDKSRPLKLRGCPELFDYILHISCHKTRYEKNIYTGMIEEVLAYMKTIDLRPTLRTYTSMMEGWKMAKRLEPIERLWASLVQAGVKLDGTIWSSRISALGSLGSPWSGIKALSEMDDVWKQAVGNGTEHMAVKPEIASVNAAISGLLRRDRMDAVRKVLVWSSEKGIAPDIYTYNMLLSRSLKQGSNEEADRILASMKTAGVAPDGATFTIILEAALDGISNSTPREQRKIIDNVFSEMAACGIEPNQETYAKMIHAIARAGDAAHTCMAAVLAHIRASGIQPSPEICTILVEFYVSGSKPDLDAIRALVDDRRSRARALADRVFWETVIKHYHRCGDLEGALDIFYDLDDWGIWPGLPLLEPLLRSLIARQDGDGAQKLVTTVRRQSRSQTVGPKDRYWRHGFWALAKDYGLLEEI